MRWALYRGRDIVEKLFKQLKSSGYTVIAPSKINASHALREVESSDEISLDFVRTVNSPKHFLYPSHEVLLEWHRRDGGIDILTPEVPAHPLAFFCIKPCDANAIHILDLQLLSDPPDPFYEARRRKSLVIVYDCTKRDEYCFCESVGHREPHSYDLWIIPTEHGYYVSVGSELGSKLLDGLRLEPIEKVSIPSLGSRRLGLESVYEKLKEKYDDPRWNEIARRCLLCGGCTATCPTCICFDIVDDVDGYGFEGRRLRVYTSCVLRSFTMVAGGRIVRKLPSDRFKFRYFHKFVFGVERFGMPLCVGCGRCASQCPAGINMVEVLRYVAP